MSLKLDKAAWKRVALRDVACHVTDRVDPVTSGLERFLAGEHIPSGDLAITSWGVIGEDPMGPMFYKRFKPGHVLYVSRRTYLRKVAVSDFEGITGEKTFVLNTIDPNVLLQEFLPFVLSAERFHAYALANSRGSVNPYLNWGELAAYEFDLPPLDEQERIADLLWSLERHRRSLGALTTALIGDQPRDTRAARTALLNELLGRSDDTWTRAPLGEFGTFTRGRRFTKKDYTPSGIACIHYGQIYTDYDAVATQAVTFVPEAIRSSLRFAQHGDLVVAGTSETVEDVCKAVAWMGDEDVAVHDDCFIYKHELDPRFASYLFASPQFQQQKVRFAAETKVVRVSAANLAKIVVPVPPLGVQREIVEAVDEIGRTSDAVLHERDGIDATYLALLAEIFGGN